MTGTSAEGWPGAGDAGSIGRQSLQTTVTAHQWVGSNCSLPELIGVAVIEVRRHLLHGICEKKSLRTIGTSCWFIVSGKGISALREYEGLKVRPEFDKSNSYQHGPHPCLGCVPQISGMLK